MGSKPLIYVCGPFRAETGEEIDQNIQNAVDTAVELAGMGFQPICPHLLGMRWPKHMTRMNDQFWLDLTMEVMRRCDVIFCLSRWGDSVGCAAEIREANRLKIPWLQEFSEALGFLAGWEEAQKGGAYGRFGSNMRSACSECVQEPSS